jgi:hypothetical protein
MAADPAAARLVQIATSKRTEPKDAIVAIRELLNRAGINARPLTDPLDTGNGQVLWDEFIQIHRRRLPVADE